MDHYANPGLPEEICGILMLEPECAHNPHRFTRTEPSSHPHDMGASRTDYWCPGLSATEVKQSFCDHLVSPLGICVRCDRSFPNASIESPLDRKSCDHIFPNVYPRGSMISCTKGCGLTIPGFPNASPEEPVSEPAQAAPARAKPHGPEEAYELQIHLTIAGTGSDDQATQRIAKLLHEIHLTVTRSAALDLAILKRRHISPDGRVSHHRSVLGPENIPEYLT